MTQDYKFLKDINFPSDIKKLSESNLQELSDEVRKEMINAVSVTGGRTIKLESKKTSNVLNFVDYLKNLAPFDQGTGIQQTQLLLNIFLIRMSYSNFSYSDYSKLLSIRHLMQAGVHLGHSSKNWFPGNAPFI